MNNLDIQITKEFIDNLLKSQKIEELAGFILEKELF